VYMGALTDPEKPDVLFGGYHNQTNGVRRIRCGNDTGGMGSSAAQGAGTYTTEFIFRISRNPNNNYTGMLINNSTGASTVAGPTTRTSGGQVSLTLGPDSGAALYPGFIISGVTAEISQIEIRLYAPTDAPATGALPNPTGIGQATGPIIFSTPASNPE